MIRPKGKLEDLDNTLTGYMISYAQNIITFSANSESELEVELL